MDIKRRERFVLEIFIPNFLAYLVLKDNIAINRESCKLYEKNFSCKFCVSEVLEEYLKSASVKRIFLRTIE